MSAKCSDESRKLFADIIRAHRRRMAECSATFERLGYLYAEQADGYAILLTRSTESTYPWRVTSFRDGAPIGHREYGHLQGGGPINSAFQEFCGHGMSIMERRR